MVGGYYLGKVFHINPDYVPYLRIVFLLIFFLYVIIKYIRKKGNKYLISQNCSYHGSVQAIPSLKKR